MEVEKRKKKKKKVGRREVEGESESDRLKKSLKGGEGVTVATVTASGNSGDPTEEEVEELYAILRRMKEAVNYFHRKGTATSEWRHALEQAEVTLPDDAENVVDDGAAVNNNKGKEVIINEGFDLNAVAPEADEHGGAQ